MIEWDLMDWLESRRQEFNEDFAIKQANELFDEYLMTQAVYDEASINYQRDAL